MCNVFCYMYDVLCRKMRFVGYNLYKIKTGISYINLHQLYIDILDQLVECRRKVYVEIINVYFIWKKCKYINYEVYFI